MTDKQATDQYWGIVNGGGTALQSMSQEEIQSLIARLNTIEGEGTAYAANLSNMMSSSKMGNLSDSLLDPKSKFYQQYASYLQKTTPGIGANTLLAPLMAGGTGYAGGQAIAQQKLAGLSAQRQDKINTGVQGFALGNIGQGANLLNQQGQLGLGYAGLAEKRRQFDNQPTDWRSIMGGVGSLAAMAAAPFTGGASLLALPATMSMGGSPSPPTMGGQQSMANPSGYQYDTGVAGYGGYSQFWK